MGYVKMPGTPKLGTSYAMKYSATNSGSLSTDALHNRNKPGLCPRCAYDGLQPVREVVFSLPKTRVLKPIGCGFFSYMAAPKVCKSCNTTYIEDEDLC